MPLPSELTPEQRQCLERVTRAFTIAEAEHKPYRDRWDSYWRQYHNYTDWKRSWASARTARDVDVALDDAKREFGAELYIPFTFTTIETILPRLLAQPPQMEWGARDAESERNTEAMRWLCEQQRERMGYALELQSIAKEGLILGIGVGLTDWRSEERRSKRLARATLPEDGKEWVAEEYVQRLWDDPFVWRVDPYDFLWDPYAYRLDGAEFVIFRAWRSTSYVLDRFRSGLWDYLGDMRAVTAGEILSRGAKQRWGEIHEGRLTAEGHPSAQHPEGDAIHEVWEFHGGGDRITVLDRELPVRMRPNPSWHGDVPFDVYRPTEIPGRMVGKSEPEPIRDLQAEINTLRSQRRDNATLVLQPPFLFDQGAVDPHDVKFGAGMMVPVNPQAAVGDAIQQLRVGEIPNSSFMEEDRLRSDIERATGLSDQSIGAASPGETATGAQLMQAAASVRIQLKAERLALEVCKPQARKMVHLNQQRILGNRTIRVPALPSPNHPDRVWAHREVGPADLAGDWDIEPLGHTMAPPNIQQDIQVAQSMSGMLGQHPGVDQRKLLLLLLEKHGIRRPESYVRADQYIPPRVLELIVGGLTKLGFPEDQAVQFIQEALDVARQEESQPPGEAPVPEGVESAAGQNGPAAVAGER